MPYYKTNSLALSYGEYWRLSPGILPFLIVSGAKLIRKPLDFGSGIPGPQPVHEMLVDPAEIPLEAKSVLDAAAQELSQQGLRPLHCGTLRDSLIVPISHIYFQDFSDPSGLFWGRCMVVLQSPPLPRVKSFVFLISRLADGRFLFTSNKPKEMDSSSLVISIYRVGAPAADLVKTQRAALEKNQIKPGVVRYETEAQREQWFDEYEVRSFEESLRAGKYLEITEDEIAIARAKRRPLKLGSFPQANPAFHPPLPSDAHREVIALMEKGLNAKQSGVNATLLLVLTVVAFAVLGRLRWSASTVGILVAVLFFHELGHFIAMKLFGYKNVRMFFIPFFGAAVTGQILQRSGWKKAVVALMGPGPGLLLGFVLAIVSGAIGNPMLEITAWILIGLNLFNLLPLTPLDGGWVMQALFFARHPVAETAFKTIASLTLIVVAWKFGMILLGLIGAFMLFTMSIHHKIAKIAGDLKREGDEGPVEGNFSPTLVSRIIPRVQSVLFGQADLKSVANLTRSVYEKVIERPPRAGATVLLLIAYLGLGVIGLAGLVVLFSNRDDRFKSIINEEDPKPFTVALSDLRLSTGPNHNFG